MRLLAGITGSVFIAVGSLGVGWLGPSSVLRTWLLFELIRNSHTAAVLCSALVVIGALILLYCWLDLGLSLRRGRGGDVRQVVASAGAWSAPLLFSLPLFSRDMFAYVGQGRLMAAGLNPYTTGMAELPGWFGIGVDPLWADTQTPYGPVFVWLERVVVMTTDALPTEVAVFAFRLIAVAGLAMLAYYAWRIARLRGLDEAVVLWVVAASPLVIMNFVVAGHNDSLMLGFIVAGVYYALKDRPILGVLLVTVAIGVKPIALIALPIVGLIWAGRAAGWGTVIRRWLTVSAISLGSLAVMGWSIGVGLGWIGALATPISISSWYSPSNIVGIALGGLANGVGVDGEIVATVVKLAMLALGCAAAAYLLIARRRADPVWLLLGCFSVIILASSVIHPWYALWLLTMLALAGAEKLWRIRVIVYSTAFFMMIGLTEPLDLIPRLDTDPTIPVGVIGLAFLGAVALVVLAERQMRRRGVVPGMAVPTFAG